MHTCIHQDVDQRKGTGSIHVHVCRYLYTSLWEWPGNEASKAVQLLAVVASSPPQTCEHDCCSPALLSIWLYKHHTCYCNSKIAFVIVGTPTLSGCILQRTLIAICIVYNIQLQGPGPEAKDVCIARFESNLVPVTSVSALMPACGTGHAAICWSVYRAKCLSHHTTIEVDWPNHKKMPAVAELMSWCIIGLCGAAVSQPSLCFKCIC